MKRALFVAPFNELADPRRLVDLAATAEATGWDGLFLWDHVLRRPEESPLVADPFVSLAAVAVATSRLRLATMVTPPVRRRPQVLARQVATLDLLSGGRATLGLGLGVDTTGELSRFGELVDEHERADLLDEAADLLARMLAGEWIEHRGRYFTADGVRLLPTGLQQPRVPIWLGARGRAGRGPAARPVRRAARFDGLFLIDATPDDLARAVGQLEEAGRLAAGDPFELAVLLGGGITVEAAATARAAWVVDELRPQVPLAQIEAFVAAGPPG